MSNPDNLPAETATDNNSPRLAQVISDVFSPLLIPAYTCAVMMWFTYLVLLPERTRLYTTMVIALLTAVLPSLLILLLRRIGKVSDAAISKRSERFLPMGLAVLCYLGAAWYLYYVHAPWWAGRFYLGAAIACIIAMVITLRWKISAHTTAISGMLGMILWLAFRHLLLLHPMWVITVAMMLCGIIGSCRLMLRRHSFAQVGAGFLLGLACAIVTLCV